MPTYSYHCAGCAEDFEITQSITDKALDKCPKCSGQVTKIFGKVGISFKGSGFYKTDSTPPPKAD